ncbi:Lipopolysaccharide assembly protein B [Alphaproteobacteria bacterium SO-S41]|nr:Lipopolysaccharide assembly protein B [Alphaproteobacteria bacterium SO-S41]
MIRLVWLFLVAAAIAVAAALLAGQQGEVVIAWGSTEFRMAPAVAAALAFAGIAVLIALWRLVGFLLDWPGAMSHWRRERRRKAGYLSLARGMVAVAAGDAREARRHQARAKAAGDEPLLSQLLAAQTAQLEGDEDGAARAYADMLGRPETEFLGLRGLFMQATRRGDTVTARRHAARAFALRPQTPWVATALFELEAQAGDWPAAEKALDAQAKAKLLTPDITRRRRAVLAAADARERLAAGQSGPALDRARDALKIAPGLLAAALVAARAYRTEGRIKRAAAVLERAWAAAPHPDLAAAYADLAAGPAARRFDRLIALNPTHPESRLLSAAQEAARGAYGEAEGILQPLLTPHPGGRAARLMADIAEARGDATGARLWSDRALRAPRDGVWRCEACGHEAAGWTAICAKCAAFDTLSWTQPEPVAAPALLEDDAADALYRLAPPEKAEEVRPPLPDVEDGSDWNEGR